jgi:hypothetical protein
MRPGLHAFDHLLVGGAAQEHLLDQRTLAPKTLRFRAQILAHPRILWDYADVREFQRGAEALRQHAGDVRRVLGLGREICAAKQSCRWRCGPV